MRWCRVRDSVEGRDVYGLVSDGHELLLDPTLTFDDVISVSAAGRVGVGSSGSLPNWKPDMVVPASDAAGHGNRFALQIPVPTPSKILCVGLNYADHIKEFWDEPPPEHPLVFAKLPSALVATHELIHWSPNMSSQVDYEAELAVVIAKTCRNVSTDQALDYVLGYTAANDVSARDRQMSDGQWTRAKGMDTFCPVGPYLLTPDECDSPDYGNGPLALSLRSRVNGEIRQDAVTSEMIFSVPEIIAYCSRFCTLARGDIILTGTPVGIGMSRKPPVWLQHGDKVGVQIETPKGFSMVLENTCYVDGRSGK
jgi:2-keto-4-pentenoate hydratase/2-oxohepta-3-ene-1,7-dioic acid hydratase in catechol pathway